jgi:hypothetical protein
MAITIYPENYYDDYNTPDANGLTPEEKNYLRILFKPGQTVQARELNQIQSILQSQVDKLGTGLFRSNSPVVGGAPSFNDRLNFIDVEIANEYISVFEEWIKDLQIIELKQSETNLAANINSVELLDAGLTEESSKIYRIFISYTSNDVNESGESTAIFDTTIISILNIENEVIIDGSISNQGEAVGVSINDGIFFVKGCVVPVKSQFKAVAIDDEEELFTGYAVLTVLESAIGFSEDNTLLDNSNGYPNFAAPGGDRYKIDLNLNIVKNIGDNINNIILLEIQDSNIILENTVENNESALNDIFAVRTFEESGDYVIRPFTAEIREIWGGDGTDNNIKGDFNGLYKDVQDLGDSGFSNPTDSRDSYAVTIQPSTAYVKGYRVELPEQISLFADKARETYSDKNNGSFLTTAINADLGTYIEGTFEVDSGLPDIDYDIEYKLYAAGDEVAATCRVNTIESLGEVIVDDVKLIKARLYLHDIKRYKDEFDNTYEGRIFKEILYLSRENLITGLGLVKFNIIEKNGKKIHDTGINSSLFSLPQDTIKSVNSIRTTEKRVLNGEVAPDSNVVTVTALDNGLIDKSPSNLIVMVDNDGASDVTYINSDQYTIDNENAVANQLTLTINNGNDYFNKSVRIIASVQTNLTDKQGKKVLTPVVDEDITDTYLAAKKVQQDDDLYEFQIGDIITLTNVYHLISVDTTEWELVFDGQTKSKYRNARIRCLKAGSTKISYTHWNFIGNGNFYTVNSYKYANDSQVTLDDMPAFQKTGLNNFIDTRYIETSSGRLSLDPYSTIEIDLNFYLARKDIITVNTNGIFSIIKGEADLNPEFPSVPDDCMVLFNLTLFPYTFDIKTIIKDRVNNKRYTMRDIGQLETRIGNVEYYTSLSLLEKSAKDKGIYGTDGLERFKNGFIVDGFRGHNVGNVSEKYYKCSINRKKGKLYPYHFGSNLPFDIIDDSEIAADAEFNKSCSTKRVIGFPYKETDYVKQELGTQFISVQPYEIINSSGIMELNPEVDTWVDTKTDPAIETDLFNELNTTIANLAKEAGVLGTEWDAWTTINSTVLSQQSETNILSESSILLGDESRVNTSSNTERVGFFNGNRGWTNRTTTEFDIIDTQISTVLSENIESETRELDQTRTGTRTQLTEDAINKSLGTFLTAVQYQPYMRARQVWVRVEDLKPNTRYYAFFDDVDVTRYVTKYSKEDDVLDKNPNAWSGRGFRYFNRTQLRAPNGRQFDGQNPFALVSDSNGVLQAIFIVPNTPDLKFASGEKTLKFTDSPRNLKSEETSSAIAKYISNGLSATQQESIVSTSVPRLVIEPLSRERTVERTIITDVSQSVETSIDDSFVVESGSEVTVRRHDPVAQTFFVKDNTGIYATSVDVYFQKKGRRNVRAYLVTVKNGYPTNKIIPGSEKVLSPDKVKTSRNSSIATTFEFKKPIYLNGKTEYAVVVFSTDPSYTVYIAEMGGDKVDLITKQIISKQPAVGTFFTSSNKRTWTAEQNRDLKFMLRRAHFKIGRASIKAQARIGSYIDRIEVDNGGLGYTDSTIITIEAPVYFDNITDSYQPVVDGVAAEAVAVIDANDGKITSIIITNEGSGYLDTPLVTITDIGQVGEDTATALAFLPEIKFAAANLTQSAMSVSGKTSITNKLTLNNKQYNIKSNQPIELRDSNHAVNAGNAEDTSLNIIIGTSDNRVTPMLEKRGMALEVRSYFIKEKDAGYDETETSQYYTKKITLDTPSDQLDVYAAVNRPTPTAEIQFFVKMFDDSDDAILDESDNEWWEIAPTEPKSVPINADGKTYNDILFRKSLEDEGFEFTSFIIKTVLWGKNNTDVVTIKDLRIIATA